MIVRIIHPNQLERMIPQVTALFRDFLRRAKEPFALEHQWAAVLNGLAKGPSFLFLLALDERIRPVGYAICQSGQDFYGIVYGNVIQVYLTPGVRGVLDDLHEKIEEWADTQKAMLLSALTHRSPKGYTKWIQQFGFVPFSAMYVKIRGDQRGEVTTTAADHDQPVSARVPPVRSPSDLVAERTTEPALS